MTSGNPHHGYKKPFDILAEGTDSTRWLESIESIRNWLETTGPTDLEILLAFKLPF
jgi:hypothetical protein